MPSPQTPRRSTYVLLFSPLDPMNRAQADILLLLSFTQCQFHIDGLLWMDVYAPQTPIPAAANLTAAEPSSLPPPSSPTSSPPLSLSNGTLVFAQLHNDDASAVTPGMSFKGSMDEIRLWNSIRSSSFSYHSEVIYFILNPFADCNNASFTATQIRSLMRRVLETTATATPDLVSYWSFDPPSLSLPARPRTFVDIAGVNHGLLGSWSATSGILFESAASSAPVIGPSTAPISGTNTSIYVSVDRTMTVLIPLQHVDTEAKAVPMAYRITTLPLRGTLYTTLSNGTQATPITTPTQTFSSFAIRFHSFRNIPKHFALTDHPLLAATRVVSYQPAPIVWNGDNFMYGVRRNDSEAMFEIGSVVAEVNVAPVADDITLSAFIGYVAVRSVYIVPD
jgi:hypothetical protein